MEGNGVSVPQISHSPRLERAQELVAELYTFNKHYLETHGLSAAAKKRDEVRTRMEGVVEELDRLQGAQEMRLVYIPLMYTSDQLTYRSRWQLT